jgi:hypothetical protein
MTTKSATTSTGTGAAPPRWLVKTATRPIFICEPAP